MANLPAKGLQALHQHRPTSLARRPTKALSMLDSVLSIELENLARNGREPGFPSRPLPALRGMSQRGELRRRRNSNWILVWSSPACLNRTARVKKTSMVAATSAVRRVLAVKSTSLSQPVPLFLLLPSLHSYESPNFCCTIIISVSGSVLGFSAASISYKHQVVIRLRSTDVSVEGTCFVYAVQERMMTCIPKCISITACHEKLLSGCTLLIESLDRLTVTVRVIGKAISSNFLRDCSP